MLPLKQGAKPAGHSALAPDPKGTSHSVPALFPCDFRAVGGGTLGHPTVSGCWRLSSTTGGHEPTWRELKVKHLCPLEGALLSDLMPLGALGTEISSEGPQSHTLKGASQLVWNRVWGPPSCLRTHFLYTRSESWDW